MRRTAEPPATYSPRDLSSYSGPSVSHLAADAGDRAYIDDNQPKLGDDGPTAKPDATAWPYRLFAWSQSLPRHAHDLDPGDRSRSGSHSRD